MLFHKGACLFRVLSPLLIQNPEEFAVAVITDITEKVYTERNRNWLKEEIKKNKIACKCRLFIHYVRKVPIFNVFRGRVGVVNRIGKHAIPTLLLHRQLLHLVICQTHRLCQE